MSSPASSVANVASTRVVRSGRAQMKSGSDGSIRIRHHEYFADVVSTGTGFQAVSYPIQPAMSSIFPWLSQIAQRYETYRFNSLKFTFATQQATTAVGSVIMAVDYDALDVAPASKSDALSYKDAVRSAPWKEVVMNCANADMNKLPQRNMRVGTLSNVDLKTYDVGNLHVCLQGVAAATVGELYAEYDVTLFTPQIGPNLAFRARFTTGVDTNNYFGTAITSYAGAIPFQWTSGTTLTFTQKFEGLLTIVCTGTVVSADMALNGTATSSATDALVNGAATSTITVFRIRAEMGQTIIPTMTETTFTGMYVYGAPGTYSSLYP